MKKITVLLMGLMILQGCASFQLSGTKKEVIVDRISPNTFTVTFCGNAYMSQKEVEKYALQRASSEALARGCSNFVIAHKEDKSRICVLRPGMDKNPPAVPPTAPTMENWASSDFVEPNVTLTIQCLREGKTVPENAVNAKKFLDDNFPGLENNR